MYRTIFFRWAKNKGIYSQFTKNLINYKKYTFLEISLENFMNNLFEDSNDIIDRAFIWSRTKENHEFWEDLDGEWNQYVAKNNLWKTTN